MSELQNITMPSIARTGKSYTLIQEAVEKLEEPEHQDKRIVYLSSAHSEAKAAHEKWVKHGVDAGYLVGEKRAKQEYNLSRSGGYTESFRPRTPEEAGQRDDVDNYLAHIEGCKDAQVVVTVPELLPKIDERDWLIMTEEAAFSRMLSSSVPVMDVKRFNGWDRAIGTSMMRYKDAAANVEQEIRELDQTDITHDHIRTGCRIIRRICNVIEDWKPSNWHEVSDNWDRFREDVQGVLDSVAFEEPPDLPTIKKRLRNYNGFNDVNTALLNLIFHDGLIEYGEDSDNRKQMYAVGDCDRLFVDLPDDITCWLAGNSIPAMQEFHELCHGGKGEVKPFYGGYTPVQDSVVVIRYTGGKNQNIQSSHVQQVIEEVQRLKSQTSALIVSGSSKYTAEHAERIAMTTTPSHQDDLDTIEQMANAGMSIAIPENSSYSEGVDTPFFDMGAIYNGNFATPREDYIEKKTGDRSLKTAEKMRAAQNSILRPSDVPDGAGGTKGTGKTPVIVPDRHVPEEIFELFDEYGVTVLEFDDIVEVRRMVIHLLDLEAEEHDGTIMHPDDTPDEIKEFRALFTEVGSPG